MPSIIHSNPRKWAALRRRVLAAAGYRCQLQLTEHCLVTATEVDHWISRMDGGTDDFSNLRAACSDCNRRKGGASGPRFFKDAAVTERWSSEKLSLFTPLIGDYSPDSDA